MTGQIPYCASHPDLEDIVAGILAMPYEPSPDGIPLEIHIDADAVLPDGLTFKAARAVADSS
jgi:hypothetical protein